jgi:hypothetical protein
LDVLPDEVISLINDPIGNDLPVPKIDKCGMLVKKIGRRHIDIPRIPHENLSFIEAPAGLMHLLSPSRLRHQSTDD